MKENATRKMAPGLDPKNSATGTENIFRALGSATYIVREVREVCVCVREREIQRP